MSLNWSIAKVKNYKDLQGIYSKSDTLLVPPKDPAGSWLNSLIWATIAVDLGEITDKNLPEWEFRLEVLKARGSSIASNIDGDVWPTRPELERFIGLSTNVHTTTRKQFLVKQGKILERKATDVLYYKRQREGSEAVTAGVTETARLEAEAYQQKREAKLKEHAAYIAELEAANKETTER